MNISPTAWIEAFEKYLGQTKGWLAMHERVKALEARIAELEKRQSAPTTTGDVCDNCGSNNIDRIGSRPSPGPFGDLGLKEAIYHCRACGKDSFIEIPKR